MTSRLDIAICGCGPAGLAAALLLHRAGHRVRLFERFDTPRPVGSGLILQPTGLGVLAELGLIERITDLGARIERLYGRVVPSGRIVLDVRYRAMGDGWHAIAIHRAALFDTLHDAVCAAGMEIVTATAIERVQRKGVRPAVIAARGRQVGTFDLVVDALGANSPLGAYVARKKALKYGALWASIPWQDDGIFAGDALEQRYRRASGMAGVLPIGRRIPGGPMQAAFFWSLKRSDVEQWRARDIVEWKASVAELWPQAASLIHTVVDHDQLTFARYDHFTAAKPYSDRLVHIGDAAHATSPQLGQGANMALLDALALSRALDANHDLSLALPAYAALRYWHVRLFQWASAMFTPFYQSDSWVLPFLRDRIAAPIAAFPAANALLARLVAGMTTVPLTGSRFSPLRLGPRGAPDSPAAKSFGCT